MKHRSIAKLHTTSTSALFLDRDGTLNVRLIDDYVKRPDEFELIPGTLEALAMLQPFFCRIFIVTNQQGIGKGLMTEQDLVNIHNPFLLQAKDAGVNIDKIYFCPNLKSDHSFYRKPSIGMALQARRDYPEISLKDSFMIGDSRSDMLFGRRAQMTTILVGDETQIAHGDAHLVDRYHPTLLQFAQSFVQEINPTSL